MNHNIIEVWQKSAKLCNWVQFWELHRLVARIVKIFASMHRIVQSNMFRATICKKNFAFWFMFEVLTCCATLDLSSFRCLWFFVLISSFQLALLFWVWSSLSLYPTLFWFSLPVCGQSLTYFDLVLKVAANCILLLTGIFFLCFSYVFLKKRIHLWLWVI